MKKKKHTKLYEWQMRCNEGLEKCKCGETRDLTVDHIVPVTILEQFNMEYTEVLYDMEDNFEILCRYCNRQKGGNLDMRNPKTYVILERMTERAKKYFI